MAAAEPAWVRRWSAAAVLTPVALALAGIAVVGLALLAMPNADALVKLVLVAGGCILLMYGVGAVGRAVFGPTFDLGIAGSCVWLGCLIAAAALADVLPFAEHLDASKTLHEPGNLRPDLFSRHPLGTNNFSLDLLAQAVYGARVSLLTASLAVAVSIAVGGTVGMIAGFKRGGTDLSIGVVNDTLMSFPAIVLLVALAAVLGVPTTVGGAVAKTGMALAVVGAPTIARLARASTLAVAQREFVVAARSLGARDRRIVVREIAPNVAVPVGSYAFIVLATLIIAEGSLSFLGLGLQQPQPTWGNMIAQADLATLRQTPHVALVPGAFMFLTVYSLNRVGEGARQRWGSSARHA